MKRTRRPSKSSLAVIELLLRSGTDGEYGYAIMQAANLKSGTLYPILMRLKSRGYLEAEWRASDIVGRPPRQVYRLNNNGLRYARTVIAENDTRLGTPQGTGKLA